MWEGEHFVEDPGLWGWDERSEEWRGRGERFHAIQFEVIAEGPPSEEVFAPPAADGEVGLVEVFDVVVVVMDADAEVVGEEFVVNLEFGDKLFDGGIFGGPEEWVFAKLAGG